MNKTKALAIAHYERMIAWAKLQPFLFPIDEVLMKKSIGENWQGSHCSYCNEQASDCSLCVLDKDSHWDCCDGLWKNLNTAKSWGEWIFAAKALLQYIKDNG